MLRIQTAIIRPPSATFADGLTTAGLGAPDLELAREQHAAYCDVLASLGVELVRLPADDAYPDSTFVEDTAVITARGAIVTRPGAPSRRGETAAIVETLRRLGAPLAAIDGPGTVDGGDVCQIGDRFLIGRSERTDATGAAELSGLLGELGYEAEPVDVATETLLHLKSGLSWLGGDRVVVVAELAQHPALRPYRRIEVEPEESYAANCIAVNGSVIVPAGYPRVAERLAAEGLIVETVEVSEFRRMDGGVSCLSLRLPWQDAPAGR